MTFESAIDLGVGDAAAAAGVVGIAATNGLTRIVVVAHA
jgi:hypothetical protein